MTAPHRPEEGPAEVPPTPTTTPTPWWRTAVVYQVYIRSFADGDGDGTGDITGLRSRLGYLQELGVDAIWINPWYRSPLHDGGYDVADYRVIEPRYGTVDEATALIAEAHERNIAVIIDLVPNHTSTEHAWFQEALAAPIGHPSRARYHIRPGRGPQGSLPPTDWISVFGGPAWERLDDGEWYLHLFDRTQADLNWTNPEVVAEFEDIFRFWLDRGVDGFRVDVAHGCAKDMTFPDLGENQGGLLEGAKALDHPFWDRDALHEIARGWRRVLDGYDGERMMVAEAWVAHPDRLANYLRPDEYHQSFNFGFLEADWSATSLREALVSAMAAATTVGSAPTWVLSNHDVMRHPTRYGLPVGTDWRRWPLDGPHDLLDPVIGRQRAMAATLLMLSLPGSAYLYQGEELGLPEVWDLPLEVLDDPAWEQSGRTIKGRDGCRVPLPWSADGPSFGFGPNGSWLPMPAAFGALAAETQAEDPTSTLSFYRSAIALRRQYLCGDDAMELLDTPPDVLAVRRGSGVTCWVNLGTEPVVLPKAPVLLSSLGVGRIHPGLAPNEAVLLAPGD